MEITSASGLGSLEASLTKAVNWSIDERKAIGFTVPPLPEELRLRYQSKWKCSARQGKGFIEVNALTSAKSLTGFGEEETPSSYRLLLSDAVTLFNLARLPYQEANGVEYALSKEDEEKIISNIDTYAKSFLRQEDFLQDQKPALEALGIDINRYSLLFDSNPSFPSQTLREAAKTSRKPIRSSSVLDSEVRHELDHTALDFSLLGKNHLELRNRLRKQDRKEVGDYLDLLGKTKDSSIEMTALSETRAAFLEEYDLKRKKEFVRKVDEGLEDGIAEYLFSSYGNGFLSYRLTDFETTSARTIYCLNQDTTDYFKRQRLLEIKNPAALLFLPDETDVDRNALKKLSISLEKTKEDFRTKLNQASGPIANAFLNPKLMRQADQTAETFDQYLEICNGGSK